MSSSASTRADERITWLERPGHDFPYYSGQPADLTPWRWTVLMLAVVAAFLGLILGPRLFKGPLWGYVPVMFYVGLPLIVLALVSQGHWQALFRRVGGREVLLMILFAILSLAVTIGVGSVLIRVTETTRNSAVAAVASKDTLDAALFFFRAMLQLLGEEIMTILPFLALLWLLTTRLRTGRVTAIVLAWLLTALLFAIEHLPTYRWNVVQALGGVGIVRLVLTVPYIMTKNLWVSTGAHVLNDWSMFGVSMLASHGDAAG